MESTDGDCSGHVSLFFTTCFAPASSMLYICLFLWLVEGPTTVQAVVATYFVHCPKLATRLSGHRPAIPGQQTH